MGTDPTRPTPPPAPARPPVTAPTAGLVVSGGWQIEGPPGHDPARRAAGRGADGGIFHRPDPQPAHPRGVRRGRDAVLYLVRRARARARRAVADRRGHLHRRDATTRISRPHDQAAPGRHPTPLRLAGNRAGAAHQPGHLRARADPRRQDGQDAGAATRRSAAAAGHHRHVDPPRPARSRPAGRDGLQLCERLGRRRDACRGLLPAGQTLVAAAPGKKGGSTTPSRSTTRRRPISTPILSRPESRPRKTRPCGARCRGPAGWARAG